MGGIELEEEFEVEISWRYLRAFVNDLWIARF